MSRIKKTIAEYASILIIIILVNAIIIKSAYVNNPGLYWLLLLSIPMLFLAIAYARKKKKILISKNADKNLEWNIENNKMHGGDSSFFSNKNEDKELTVLFGNSHCAQPYLSSIVCNEAISANKNSNFIQRETGLFKNDNFSQELVEDIDITEESEDDIIWQIGPGYPGCSNKNFNFNAELFRLKAARPFVKMIELRLGRPAMANDVLTKKDMYANAANNRYPRISLQKNTAHTTFGNAESMVLFLDSLRQLSGKKPVGIRLSIKDKKEFHEICYAFRKTAIIPDYIVIECYVQEENPLLNSSPASGMPLYEALLFVSKTLERYGLEKEVKIIAVTPVYTAFDILKLHALGAHAIRMQNFGEIDGAQKALSPEYIKDLRAKIMRNVMKIMKACGYINLKDITLPSLLRRFDSLQLNAFNKIFESEVEINRELKTLHRFKKLNNEEKRNPVFFKLKSNSF